MYLSDDEERLELRRRDFLRMLAGAAAGLSAARFIAPFPASAATAPASAPSSAPSTTAQSGPDAAARRARRKTDRNLVVIELQGGNDGLSTLVPREDAGYRKLRSNTLIDPATSLDLARGFGLHPKLTRLHKRNIAVVAGLGVDRPDGSHFEMMRRWWLADPNGDGEPAGGFLGRLCDTIGDPDSPAVGLGIGGGPSPALSASRVATLALPDLGGLELFRPNRDDDALTVFQSGFRSMATARYAGLGSAAAAGSRRAMQMTSRLDRAMHRGDGGDGDGGDGGYPSFGLAQSLRGAAQVLAAGLGTQVIHVTIGGFDTHSNHVDSHGALMDELDQSVDAFMADLDRRGLSERTLIATTSEFGRRAKDNGSNGLDHGGASVGLLLGPVKRGVHGEPSSLTKLDRDDNLRATTPMLAYYSTLAQWMGVPGDEIFVRAPRSRPLAGVLA